ncbi:hypothetical protein KC960_01910, partial [Candidatus Saccharibacteria bacterium]|nr:hypothetical protein [Candidatus Saccharibacteria bacterium]
KPTESDVPFENTKIVTGNHEVEGTNWSPEERLAITNTLTAILERRGTHGGKDLERYKQLQEAAVKLPDELDSLLTEYTDHLATSGVYSIGVYILGGFARESTGQLVDPDNGVDTAIRPDTDIDIVVQCTPKEGIELRPNRIPSPFSPILRQWRESEISGMTDLSFYVRGTNVDLKQEKPRIQLLQRDLSNN